MCSQQLREEILWRIYLNQLRNNCIFRCILEENILMIAMITSAENGLPEHLRKQFCHNDVEHNSKHIRDRNEVDSDCDVSSESSCSSKSELSYLGAQTFPALQELDLGTGKPLVMEEERSPAEMLTRKADFSIQSLLSPKKISHQEEGLGNRPKNSSAAAHEPHNSLNSRPDPHAIESPQMEQFYKYFIRRDHVTSTFNSRPEKMSHLVEWGRNGSPVETEKISDGETPFYPHFSATASERFLNSGNIAALASLHISHIHAPRPPISFPSMMPRFRSSPFEVNPFRSPFSSPSIPIPWLQNETILRNLAGM